MDARDEVGEVPTLSAHERFKARSRRRFWRSMGLATLSHLLLVVLWRPFSSAGDDGTPIRVTEMHAVRPALVDEVRREEIRRPVPPAPIGAREWEGDDRSSETSRRPTGPQDFVIGNEVEQLVEEALATIPPTAIPPPVVPPLPTPVEEAEEPGLERFRQVTPLMQKPELTNRSQVRRALLREYPRALQRQGIEGSVIVWFWIDERGKVEKYEIRGSSGHPALDAAAERVIPIMKFRPAKEKGEAIPVVVTLPIRFQIEY